MLLMGMDIASYKTGMFILDTENIRFKSKLIDIKSKDIYERIRDFNKITQELLDSYKPDIIIIESTFLDEQRKHKTTKKRGNINTLKVLEKFHGVFLSNTQNYMDIQYMSPTEHKETLTGIGHAGKQSTIWIVQKKLGIVGIDDNMADAAALVLAFLVKRKQWEILEKIKHKYENN